MESPLDLDCPPSVVAMIQSVPFVSASRLMSQLTPVQEWFNRARSAGTLIVEITGLPGSGKKRAAETLLLYFKLRGLKVLRTHIESASRPGGQCLLSETVEIDQEPCEGEQDPETGSGIVLIGGGTRHLTQPPPSITGATKSPLGSSTSQMPQTTPPLQTLFGSQLLLSAVEIANPL